MSLSVKDHIVAYDLGTSGCKASLYTLDGSLVSSSSVGYVTYYPQAGFHEQRPEDWWDAVCRSTRELLDRTQVKASRLAALARCHRS